MKQCARCGQQLNDNEQFCTRCGGTNFRVVPNQSQQVRPNNIQQRPMNNGIQQQRPMNNNGMNNVQQRPMQNTQQGQQVRPQVNRPNQPNKNNMQNNTMQNTGESTTQQNNQFTDTPVLKLRKMSKKEKQSKEMELMYAKKAANEHGEYFDDEIFKQQHGWYEDGSTSNVTSGDMSVGDWIKTLLIMLIPIVNIIVAVLGIRNSSNPDYKKNYYKAFLIYYVVAFILSALVTFLL